MSAYAREINLLGAEELEESARGGFSSFSFPADRSGYRSSLEDDRLALAAKTLFVTKARTKMQNHTISHMQTERIKTIYQKQMPVLWRPLPWRISETCRERRLTANSERELRIQIL